MAAIKFCGNPRNHDAHDFSGEGFGYYHCEGVSRATVSDKIVERHEPELKEDQTLYAKVTVIVETYNNVQVLEVESAPYPEIQFSYDPIEGLDMETHDEGPRLRKIGVSIEPRQGMSEHYYTISEMKEGETDGQK